MTALDRQPINKNYQSPLNFTFGIKKLPGVEFFVQRVNIPSINLPPPSLGNPFNRIPEPGDHIEWGALTVDFRITEGLSNFLEIYRWMMALGFPEKYKQYREISTIPLFTGEGLKSDISVMVQSSARNPTHEIIYRDAFPVGLSVPSFSTMDTDVNYMLATATFTYRDYTIQGINNPEIEYAQDL